MAIKLHRCSLMWFKAGMHPCWRVQSALDEQGIEYEVVTGPLRRGKREDVKRLSGPGRLSRDRVRGRQRLPRGVRRTWRSGSAPAGCSRAGAGAGGGRQAEFARR